MRLGGKSDDEMILDALDNQVRTITQMITNCSFPDIRDALQRRREAYLGLLRRRKMAELDARPTTTTGSRKRGKWMGPKKK